MLSHARFAAGVGDGFANPGLLVNCASLSNSDDGVVMSFNGEV
jgi:hypothetical protein